MDIDLTYTADGRLLDGVSLLAQVHQDGLKGYGRVCVGPREYEIATTGHGWHFALEDPTGAVACAFEPFRFPRGGRLATGGAVGGGEVKLQGRIGRPRAWRFASPEGTRVNADVRVSAARVGSDNDRHSPLSGIGRLEVHLHGSISTATYARAPMLLAFGCWIVIQWESVPVGGAASAGGY